MTTRYQMTAIILGTLGSLLGAASSHATVLVYEPFDYTTGALAGKGGTSDFGFDAGSTWADGSPHTVQVQAGSLSFGSMATLGNKFRYAVAGTDNSTAFRALDVSRTSGDLWMAFVLQNVTLTARLKGGVYVTGSVGNEFGAFTALPGGSTTNDNVQQYYNNVRAEGGANPSGTNMWILKYTGLGSASGGTATLWIIDSSAYNAIALDGVATEAELDANNILTVTQTLGGAAAALNANELLRLYLYDNGSGNTEYLVDEIRIATNLGDAVDIHVPEPSTLSLAVLGLAGLLLRRRRNK